MSEQYEKENDVLLSVRDLEVVYTSAGAVIHAVNGVSLEIKRGQSLGLVGETGAGKTTIAKSILGIFSIDLSRPITMTIYSDDCDDLLRDLDGYLVKDGEETAAK